MILNKRVGAFLGGTKCFPKWSVYDERRLSDAEIQTLLKERSVRALAEIRRILDEDTPDETCFEKIERVIKVYEAIGADGGARHDF